MFPDVADDPAAHVLYTLKFVEFGIAGSQLAENYSNQCWITLGLGLFIVLIWCPDLV